MLRVLIACVSFLAAAGARGAETQGVESDLLTGTRQLIFEGKRAGEGYFSADGRYLVFQSERMPDNPFYQIYLMNLDTGDVERVSPGYGKTTCAWIHPHEKRVLFASTHEDPDARKKQEEELAFRASGQQRRYAWDYDEHFELYAADFDGGNMTRLTDAAGYDAEGSWSPDGEWIVFASNRAAYAEPMNAADAEAFKLDPAYMMDIYRMRADGTDLERLTDVKGYDGGPFFSPDGRRITWRRFSENGATAEIMVMNADGSEQRALTKLGAMSWAPYFHPSGEYLIFTTNLQGFANFELYLVDAAGQREPVRVTYTDGFDGLPVFSPDGQQLAWTSNRTANGSSQIFIADWNDAAARERLGLGGEGDTRLTLEGEPDFAATAAAIRPEDMRLHVEYLASEYMQGRMTGTEGEKRATQYVAEMFEKLGLVPAGDRGTFFQAFEFTAGVSLDEGNALRIFEGEHPRELITDRDWRPLAFSQTGDVAPAEIVFAGYGIVAPKTDTLEEYDSYVHLDVKAKWVMVLRDVPAGISDEQRAHFRTHSDLRYKSTMARDRGAAGIIFVSGPNSGFREELVPLQFDTMLGETSVAAVSITTAEADRILAFANETVKAQQDKLDTGAMAMGFPIPGVRAEGTIAIKKVKGSGRNVLGRLVAGESPSDQIVIVGAHVDHLGVGRGSSSLAREDEASDIHYGADDNASGVAGVLEIAQHLAARKEAGDLDVRRDIVFAAWSGEEIGTRGSNHFVNSFAGKKSDQPLRPEIAACLNMDMIGRLGDRLIVQGVGSSSIWPGEIERRNAPVGLAIHPQNDTYLPTDAKEFYMRGVPILNAFTGVHEDYHSPRDTADKINYEGAAKIARFMDLVARAVAAREEPPDYLEYERPENLEVRANLRAYLGTIPEYAETDTKGVVLSGVSGGAPAEAAGLKRGDIIVELAGRRIENIYDYTYALEALKIGEEVPVVVIRGGERLKLKITPGSRN